MSTRSPRILTALCGILGTAALVVYFSAVLDPLPPDHASAAQVTVFATRYHDAILLDVWLQAIGTLLTVVFVLALVHLAGAATRFAGRMTLLVSGVILAMSLAEGTFELAVIQGTASGHPATAVTGFDLTNVFAHVFLIAPSLFLMLGAALLGTQLLPQVFSYLALALGVAFEILGLAGLFSATAVTMVVFLEMAQESWIVAAAITLVVRAGQPTVAGRGVAQPVVQASPER
jgi:hypothetical protein